MKVLGHEVDVFWPEFKLIAEVDGPPHERPRAKRRDRRRDRQLRAAGYTVLRFPDRRDRAAAADRGRDDSGGDERHADVVLGQGRGLGLRGDRVLQLGELELSWNSSSPVKRCSIEVIHEEKCWTRQTRSSARDE